MKIIDSNLPPPIAKPSILRRLLNRFCGYETMSGNGACPVYLERWVLGEAFGCGAYLHHFIGDDWAIDPHDHPRRFISIGLWGWYLEDVFTPAKARCPLCGWEGLSTQAHPGRFHDEGGDHVGPVCPACYEANGYCEADIIERASVRTEGFVAPWFRSFAANHLHRIRASECGNCWTLVIVLRKSRPWGFVQDGRWVAFREYVLGGKSRKSC